MPSSELLAVAIVLLSGFFVFKRRKWNARSRGLPPPPSPKGLPFIGNALDVPTKYEWEVYRRWGDELGSDIVSASALGFSVVVLNKRQLAIELLEGQSAITSSRPNAPMACDLMGWSYILPLVPYGDEFRSKRKLFHQHFHSGNTSLYRAGIHQNLPHLLTRLLEDPQDFRQSNTLFMAGTLLKITYGVDDKESTRYYIQLFEEALAPIIRAAIPGSFLVDIFPVLKYVPEWFPGAGFKREAREALALSKRFADEPLNDALKRMNAGTVETSFISEAHSSAESQGALDANAFRDIRDIAASLFSAGTETTLSSLDYFYLAMTLFPKAQERAHKELDAVLKGERLADFNDKPDLPYITAIVKEVLRWQPVVPLGVAHFSTEDCVFKGYFIPKNTIIMANQWAMLRDDAEYPEPEMFKPERFLTPDGQLDGLAPDSESIAFGFGRRICPGDHIATSTLFMAIASILTLFDIKKLQDFDPEREVRLGINRCPTDFRCEIKPRLKNAHALIQAHALQHSST
ncbi:cytochrome P450 [Coprinopsis marcescibilis]|uniref:Cytochrome P450 n=1 Tax=Coprinopsis marcescibilis TaxID=230819 RepID=A0A5C3KX47_COPMA|nr:cytochrome P450 [Coprinopsis marcescibilis]